MKRRALLSVIGVTTLAGCIEHLGPDTPTESELPADSTPTGSETPSVAATTTVSDESPLELASHDIVRSNEGSASELVTVTGVAHNTTEKTVAEATVTAAFEDANGAVLAHASVSAPDLSPAESWSFELVYPGTGEDARAVADYALTAETTT